VRRPMRCGLGELRRFACRTAEHVASVSAEPDRAGRAVSNGLKCQDVRDPVPVCGMPIMPPRAETIALSRAQPLLSQAGPG
jgi:hypothetical protein